MHYKPSHPNIKTFDKSVSVFTCLTTISSPAPVTTLGKPLERRYMVIGRYLTVFSSNYGSHARSVRRSCTSLRRREGIVESMGCFFTGDGEEKDNRPGRMVSTLVDRMDTFLLQGLGGLPTTSARKTQVRVPNCDR